MKKLRLNLQQLNAEVLTRSQLKQILGGNGGSNGGGGGETCPSGHLSCESDSDCAGINAGSCCKQSNQLQCCWEVCA